MKSGAFIIPKTETPKSPNSTAIPAKVKPSGTKHKAAIIPIIIPPKPVIAGKQIIPTSINIIMLVFIEFEVDLYCWFML